MRSVSSPEPTRKPPSDLWRFFSFLVGAALVLGAFGMGFVVFVIAMLSSSPEMNDANAPGLGAAIVFLAGVTLCVGMFASGVSLVVHALRDEWPRPRDLLRWTVVVVAACIFGSSPFFIR